MAEESIPITTTQDFPVTSFSIIVGVVGWAIPGAGHLIQKKWYRGTILFTCMALMYALGIWMNGKVYTPNSGDVLEMLAFVGDISTGAFYLLARTMEWGLEAPMTASSAYGTTFIMATGLLNIVSAIDAHHIALGKKP